MSAKTIAVRVDWENNAEEFWDALRAHKNGKTLEAAIDSGRVTMEQRDFLTSLPGYSNGPEHARTALVFLGRPVGTTRGQMTRTQVKLPPELLDAARKEAERREITLSALVRESLRHLLAQQSLTCHGHVIATPES